MKLRNCLIYSFSSTLTLSCLYPASSHTLGIVKSKLRSSLEYGYTLGRAWVEYVKCSYNDKKYKNAAHIERRLKINAYLCLRISNNFKF